MWIHSTTTEIGGNELGDRCGCQHKDLYSTCHGEVATGIGGSTDPENAPQNPTNPRRDDILLMQNEAGVLKYGDRKNLNCFSATYQDIYSCIKSAPRPHRDDYNPVYNNCQQDVARVADSCCLTGFDPIPFRTALTQK
jgi:hypothetical protein